MAVSQRQVEVPASGFRPGRDTGADIPFPRYSIGLLQSESEMLQVPEYDLAAFLEGDRRWDVELFTERTVHALLDSPDRFDCVVVGYNAAHKSAEIRAALEARRRMWGSACSTN